MINICILLRLVCSAHHIGLGVQFIFYLIVTYNDSPFQGKEGTKNTINQIIERLKNAADDDVSLRVKQDSERNDLIEISGRGDLHLGVLLEKMRREGFEVAAYPPQVVMKDTPEGKLEPIERVEIECNSEHMTNIIDNTINFMLKY